MQTAPWNNSITKAMPLRTTTKAQRVTVHHDSHGPAPWNNSITKAMPRKITAKAQRVTVHPDSRVPAPWNNSITKAIPWDDHSEGTEGHGPS